MSDTIKEQLKVAIENHLYRNLSECENLSDLMTEDVTSASKELFNKIEERYGKDLHVLLAATVTLQGTLMRDLISLSLTKATTGLDIERSVRVCSGANQLADVIMEAVTDYLIGVNNNHHRSFEKHVRLTLDNRNADGKQLIVDVIGFALARSKEEGRKS